MERSSFPRRGCIQTLPGPGGLGGSAPLAAVAVSVKAPSPFEDQGVCLAPYKTTPDDEVRATAHGPGLPHGVPAMRRGSEGLVARVIRLPPDPSNMASGRRLPRRGDFG